MTHSAYSLATGLFTGRQIDAWPELLEANLRPGEAWMEGAHDHLSSRVDLATGQVIDWQPPAPADTDLATHHWDAEIRRWVAEPTAKAMRLQKRARITALIRTAEQAADRPLRELLLDPTNTVARDRLTAINAEVAALRASMPPIDLPEEPAP